MLRWLEDLKNRRIAVIGDLMLDRYVSGGVDRISPEAPVPIVKISTERVAAGGAANVAINIAALGAKPLLVGVTGDDEERDELIAALQTIGEVDLSAIVRVSGRRTTSKLRIIGSNQQIVRLDREDNRPLDETTQAMLRRAALLAVDAADIVIVSDYGKNVCSDELLRAILERTSSIGKPVLVDPKRLDLVVYRGASILTPNRKELADATGLPCENETEIEAAAAKAQAACGADILLTRSEKGMSYLPMNGNPVHLGTVAQDVFDVSGAGDTVVAIMAAALSAGVAPIDAMHAANHAAGIVVSKLGTACVTPAELSTSLAGDDADASAGQLLDLAAAERLRWKWAQEKLTVGFTNGCFDLVHPGHISLLRQAAANCDRLIVALNSDASVRRLKGAGRPVQSERARAEVIGAIKGVGAVVLFDEQTPLDLVRTLQPDLLIKGADYTIDDVVGADIVQSRGGRVFLAALTPQQSTTRLAAAVLSAQGTSG